jgi:hypothetical protein
MTSQPTMLFGFRLQSNHPIYAFQKFAHITGNRLKDDEATTKAITDLLTSMTKEICNPVFVVKGFDNFQATIDGKQTTIPVVVLEPTQTLRNFLAMSDPLAIPERNGVLYHYNPAERISAEQKTSHISLGLDPDNLKRNCFQVGDIIPLRSAFLKREGPYDAHFTIEF